MIYYKNGWHLCNEKVKYKQHGEEITQYVMSEGHDWWIDFEGKWEHTEIIEFVEVEPLTEIQMLRLEEVNELEIPDGFGELVENYVIDGIFPEEIKHPLKELQLQKENEEVKDENKMLKLKTDTLADRSDFLEDVMTEIILTVVP